MSVMLCYHVFHHRPYIARHVNRTPVLDRLMAFMDQRVHAQHRKHVAEIRALNLEPLKFKDWLVLCYFKGLGNEA